MKKAALDLIEILHNKTSENIWNSLIDFLKIYFRLEVFGEENIPKGKVIILPNHSGYAGFDAVMLIHELQRITGKPAKMLVHRAYFDWFRELKLITESFGFRKASMTNGKKLLDQNEMLVIFPEAEDGNFKPTSDRYHLQKFHTGAVRLASQTGAPIVPCLIIGAEESHINLKKIDLHKFGIDLKIPAPINVFPLPAKWKIIFLPAIEVGEIDDFRELSKLAERLRKDLQVVLDKELRGREFVYFQSNNIALEAKKMAINLLDYFLNKK